MRTTALRRFCCRNRHSDGAERLVHFFEAIHYHPLDCAGDVRWTLLTLATLTQRTWQHCSVSTAGRLRTIPPASLVQYCFGFLAFR